MAWVCAACNGSNPGGTRFCGHCGQPQAAVEATDPLVARLARGQVPEPAAGSSDQRRLVTALFADITGFTTLADRLDAEDVGSVIGRIISAISEVVGRYEGYVDKYAGDALLAFFGAPTSHEDDAVRAVAAAHDMHAALDALRPALPPEAQHLELHIGVNTGRAIAMVIGSVVRNDYSVLGDAINVAQRLEAAAPPGSTYVGPLTERLTRHAFAYESVGPLQLKGKPEPVEAWRLVGPRVVDEVDVACIGRDRERAALRAVVGSQSVLGGGLALVVGEAGAGKTALLNETRAYAESLGTRWIAARGVSYQAATPYGAFAPALAALEPHAPDDCERIRALLGATDGVDPESRRFLIHRAFVAALQRVAADATVVLAFEDAHWADPASIDLVIEIVRATADAPIAVVVTSRMESSVVDRVRTASLDAPVIELGSLDEAAIGAILRRAQPGVADRVVARIIEQARGNPFFAVELLRADDGDGGGADLPATIEMAISARLDRCSRDARQVVEVAAVIGGEIAIELIDAVVAVDVGTTRALKELIDEGIFVTSETRADRVQFSHGLVLESASQRILRRDARVLHERIAEALLAGSGAPDDGATELVALHLYQARAGARAVTALRAAADRSEALFANEAAIVQLRRAIELLEESGDEARAPVVLRLASLLYRTGAYEEAAALFSELAENGGAIEAHCGLAATLRTSGDLAAAIAVLQRALDAARDDGERSRVLLELGRCEVIADSLPAARATLEAALASADSVPVRAEVLSELAVADAAAGELTPALTRAVAARDAFASIDDQRQWVSAMRVLGGVYEDLGQLDDAAATLREALEVAEAMGHVEEVAGCLVNLGLVELAHGAVADAIATNRRAVAVLAGLGHSALASACANLAEALCTSGELAEADQYARDAIELGSRRSDQLTVADARLTLARVALAQGDAAGAIAAAARAEAEFSEVGAMEWAEKAHAVLRAARAQRGD